VKDIVKKHSSFVSFPVTCNGTRVNEVSALWMKNEKDITPEEHTALYRHIASQYDDPLFHVQPARMPLRVRAIRNGARYMHDIISAGSC
jgi:TNF receptor-associated protein 1